MLSTPPATDELHFTGGNGAGGGGDRIHARPAQPVDGRSRHLLRQSGEEQRHPADVAIVFPRLVRTPEDDVVQPLPVDAGVAVPEGGDGEGGEVIRSDAGQHAGIAAERGSYRVAQIDRTDVNHGSDMVHFSEKARTMHPMSNEHRASARDALGGFSLRDGALARGGPRQEPQKPETRSAEDVKAEENFTRNCVKCHTADRVVGSRRTRTQWEEVMTTMQTARGAVIADEDWDVVLTSWSSITAAST